MGKRTVNNARIWVNRIVKLIVLLAVVLGVYYIYANWGYIKYRNHKKYEVSRYGVNWRTNLRSGRYWAEENKRNTMIVFLKSGGGDVASDKFIAQIIPSKEFTAAAMTYIPVICDLQKGQNPSPGLKTNQEEIQKEYDLFSGPGGVVVLINPQGKELGRVRYTGAEKAAVLINQLAGGKFVALPPVPIPQLRNPFAPAIRQASRTVTEMASGPVKPAENKAEETDAAAPEKTDENPVEKTSEKPVQK